MKQFTIEVEEKMTSIVTVEADTLDEAYTKVIGELKNGFQAPYHTDIYVDDWNVISEEELE